MDRRQDGVAAAEFADHSAPSQGKPQVPRAGYAEDGTTMRLGMRHRAADHPPPLAARVTWNGSRGLARSRAPQPPYPPPCRHAA